MVEYHFAIANFDFKISIGPYDVFTLVIIFWEMINSQNMLLLVLFEITKTIGQVLVQSLIDLLNKNGIRKKTIAYVKDERSNFNIMTNALESIMNILIWRNFLKKSVLITCFQKYVSMAH